MSLLFALVFTVECCCLIFAVVTAAAAAATAIVDAFVIVSFVILSLCSYAVPHILLYCVFTTVMVVTYKLLC